MPKPEPTLIAEKPSYSRGPDGRYPFGVPQFQATMCALCPHAMPTLAEKPKLTAVCLARVFCGGSGTLREEIATKSTLAQTLGRGTQAPRDYLEAHANVGKIATTHVDEEKFRKKEELSRQAEERANLAKAYKIEKGRFEAEWAQRFDVVEADCNDKVLVMKEIQEVALADSETDIAKKIAQMRYKATSTLLQLQDTETKLAKLHEYKDAAEVSARAHRQRGYEEAKWEASKAHQGTRPRAVLMELQVIYSQCDRVPHPHPNPQRSPERTSEYVCALLMMVRASALARWRRSRRCAICCKSATRCASRCGAKRTRRWRSSSKSTATSRPTSRTRTPSSSRRCADKPRPWRRGAIRCRTHSDPYSVPQGTSVCSIPHPTH